MSFIAHDPSTIMDDIQLVCITRGTSVDSAWLLSRNFLLLRLVWWAWYAFSFPASDRSCHVPTFNMSERNEKVNIWGMQGNILQSVIFHPLKMFSQIPNNLYTSMLKIPIYIIVNMEESWNMHRYINKFTTYWWKEKFTQQIFMFLT